MSVIIKQAAAGTTESSDVYVEIQPAKEITVEIESVVVHQFGDSVRESVLDVLKEQGVDGAKVRLVDRGALDCVIRARVETAVLRGKGE